MPVHSAQELVHEYRLDMHTLHNSLEFVAMPYISIFKSFKSNFNYKKASNLAMAASN